MRTRRSRLRGRRPGYRPGVDGLESRLLLAVTYQSYFLNNVQSSGSVYDFADGMYGQIANSIAVGPDHNLWFTIPGQTPVETGRLAQGPYVGVLNSSTGIVTEYPTPGVFDVGSFPTNFYPPSSIVSGPGGDLWFIDAHNPNYQGISYDISSIDPATGVINEYPVTTPGVMLVGLAAGSDGNLWFTDSANDAIGMFDPTTHATTEFPLPDFGDVPSQITPGPGGNLFFTALIGQSSVYAIGEISQTSHAITLSSLPNSTSIPVAITAGPDGNIWFNEQVVAGYQIGMLDPTTHAIAEFAGGSSGGITTGPDGNLWYDGQGMLSEFNPSTHVATSLPLPSGVDAADGGPTIVTGPDGHLVFAAQDYLVSAGIVPANQAALTGTINEDPTGSGTTDDPVDVETVYLDLNSDGKLDPSDPSTLTDALGNYSFTGLAAGTYTVRVAPYPGAFVTFPSGGSQAATVALGQVGTLGPLGVIRNNPLLPLSYAVNPFGTANPDVQTAEVIGLYRTILGRAPDALGGANAVAYLKAGGSLGQLSGDMLVSVEYDHDIVDSFYREFLDRAPAPAELAAGTASLQGGESQNQLAATILDSPEFSALFATDTAFVEQLYAGVLGRQSDAAGMPYWLARLGSGATRAEVVTGFLDSAESYGLAVSGPYEIILGGPVDPQVKANFAGDLQGGVTQVSLTAGLFSNPAFVARAEATVGGAG